MKMYIAYGEDGNLNGFAESNDGMLYSLIAPEWFDIAADMMKYHVVDGVLVPISNEPPPPPRILTHYGFRSLLTLSEQIILDNFDIPEFAAAHPVLSQFGPLEKATLRTAMKAYETAAEINLDDTGTQMFIGALAQMGLLEGDAQVRQQTILAGYPPGGLPESAQMQAE
jgi:hypothetical protein